MTNRREFLQTGAVMSVLAMHGLVPRNAAAAAASPRGASFVPDLAVYDDRYPQGRDFAAAAAAFGKAVRAVEQGDVTAIYDELAVAWRARPSSIAGFTQFGPMFVIERLAAERGMRLVLCAEHRPNADGALSHVIAGPSAALTLAGDLSTEPGFIHYYTSQRMEQGYGPALDGPLYTWLVAPVARS
jgi:hypothetical protein